MSELWLQRLSMESRIERAELAESVDLMDILLFSALTSPLAGAIASFSKASRRWMHPLLAEVSNWICRVCSSRSGSMEDLKRLCQTAVWTHLLGTPAYLRGLELDSSVIMSNMLIFMLSTRVRRYRSSDI